MINAGGSMLLDREKERVELDRVLGEIRKGFSAILVLHGEAGIGKTALLEYAIESAIGMQVARVVGVESEMEFGFAALHQLIAPFSEGMDSLPGPQRRALSSAFGLVADRTTNRFLVGLATLTLLANAALERPLLCVVDDAQWLDQASAQVLAFVARRLLADSVGMLFGLRDPAERRITLEGLDRLRVSGLTADDARALLASVSGGAMDRLLTERVLAEAHGNPLALVELGAELTQAKPASGSPLKPLPLSARLEEHFLRRVRTMPPAAQTLLLTAAADPSGDAGLLWRAAALQNVTPEAADAPDIDRLVSFVPTVEFRHPLMRSAIYHGASAAARRFAHKALAAASDPHQDADGRAWHLAESALGPDEGIATELERSAGRARSRGGWSASAAFLAKAAVLTPSDERRAVRRLEAADASLVAGAPAAAAELLELAAPSLADRRRQAEAKRLQAWVRFELGDCSLVPEMLLQAVSDPRGLDSAFVRQTLLEAWEAALHAGHCSGDSSTHHIAEVVRAMEGMAAGTSAGAPADLLLVGFAALDVDYPRAATALRAAIGLLRERDEPHDEFLQWLSLAVLAAAEIWDDDAMQALSARSVELARERGALTALLTLLRYQALVELSLGRYAAAEATLAEASATSAATGSVGVFASPHVLECALLARRGDERRAREAATDATREAVAHGQIGATNYVEAAMVVMELSLGNFREALDGATHLYDADPFVVGTAILPELIEAASRTDEHGIAARALERLSERAAASGTELALGLRARARALVSSDHEAESLYREAVERLARSRGVGDLARTHLLFGEWLRRRRRQQDAREELRAAYEIFNATGSEAFADRARAELLAAGERPRTRTPETSHALTAQEAQIARLASEGASNSEIAAQLYISSSTVAYHLRKVFRKLGVSSRTGLARALEP